MNKSSEKTIWLRRIILIGIVLTLCPIASFAEEGLDPLSYDATRQLQPVLQEAYLPPVLTINPQRNVASTHAAPIAPAVVTDDDGNKSIYRGGKLVLRIDTKGNKTFYANSLPQYEKDDLGRLTRSYEYAGARATIKNEHGETIGFKEFGQGGLLLKEFDEKNRLARTYEYTGRRIAVMVDKLTNSRTLYNEKGKPDKEVNFQGAVTATYHYGSNNKLAFKVDLYGNRTVYDDKGRPQVTYRSTGAVIETYKWDSANKYSLTDEHGRTTYYDHDRQQYETQLVETPDGVVTRTVKTYNWQGTKLISSLDIDMEETTYYENGRATETRHNPSSLVTGLWVYDDQTGILVCKVDRNNGAVSFYDHGRNGIGMQQAFEPDELSSNYRPFAYDEIVSLVRQYKDTNTSIAPMIDELWKNKDLNQ